MAARTQTENHRIILLAVLLLAIVCFSVFASMCVVYGQTSSPSQLEQKINAVDCSSVNEGDPLWMLSGCSGEVPVIPTPPNTGRGLG